MAIRTVINREQIIMLLLTETLIQQGLMALATIATNLVTRKQIVDPKNGMNNNNTATVPDQERMRKIEAFQRKQRELEATQAAEERIIREAQRRKEEDIHRHQQMQQQQQQHWRPTPGPNIPIPPPSAMSGGQRLDSVIHQSSSMEIAQQQHASSSTSTSSTTTSTTTTTKRVSFFQETDNKTTTREDPDVSEI